MLSRTASDLYWMSRYLERAENLARMLDVSYSLSLMPQDGRRDGLDELAMPLLITSEGYQVMPGINVPENATAITIGMDGTVSATIPGQAEAANLGQIQVASFPNTAGLQSIGDNYLIETASSGAPNMGVPGEDGRAKIRQGMLEASNVNVVEELVDMIETQRAYEVNSKMISATDDMLKYVNQNI